MQTTVTDSEIAHRIVEAMAWAIEVPHSGITPTVANGWVMLAGEVDWQYQRDAAARTVRCVPGVRGLTNALRVRGYPGPVVGVSVPLGNHATTPTEDGSCPVR